jgi:hypothetical protein
VNAVENIFWVERLSSMSAIGFSTGVICAPAAAERTVAAARKRFLIGLMSGSGFTELNGSKIKTLQDRQILSALQRHIIVI